MALASRILERFRIRLARLVEREKRIQGCVKAAMRSISKKIGMSETGIYRTLNNYDGNVQIKAHQYMALIMASMRAPKISQSRKTISSKLFHSPNLSA